VILFAFLAGSATAADGLSPRTRLVDLEHPKDQRTLFARFNAARGVPRIVLLVSPT
jgi:hypothetical protein